MTIISKLIKGSVFITASTILVKISGMLTIVFLARIFGKVQLGLYSLILQVVQTGVILSQLGINIAMQTLGSKFYKSDPQKAGSYIGTGLLLMLVSVMATCLSIWFFRNSIGENWLGESDIINYLGFASLILMFEGLNSAILSVLLCLHEFKIHAFISSENFIGRLLFTSILAYKFGLLGALYGLSLNSIVQLFLSVTFLILSLRNHSIRLSIQPLYRNICSILEFGLPYYFGSAILGILILPVMGELNRLAGLEAIAQIRIAQSLGPLVSFFPNAIAPIIISILSECHANEKNDFRKIRSIHLRSIWSSTLLIVLSFTIFANLLLDIAFGSEYSDAVVIVIGMAWVSFITVIAESLNSYSFSSGDTKKLSIASAIQKVLFLSITLLLAPRLGAMSFILGLISGGLLQLILMLIFNWNDFEESLKHNIFVLFCWTIVSATTTLLIKNLLFTNIYINNFFTIIITCFFIALTNIGFIYFFLLKNVEKLYLNNIMRKYCFPN